MHGNPILSFDKSLPLLVLYLHFVQRQKNLDVRSFTFIAISTQVQSNFSTKAGIHDLQLSFCEANFT